ncbi:MAG: hypothetical protein WC356_03150 [Candidatus Micrarchaeia archaeon]|jgi:mRNA-degrading endonuclease RelE of RelBE toxin-antitoxin system
MELFFSSEAEKDLAKLDKYEQKIFMKHAEKILNYENRKHLKHGVPFFVEKVSKQARIIYDIKEEKLIILKICATHKEYEKIYNTFR